MGISPDISSFEPDQGCHATTVAVASIGVEKSVVSVAAMRIAIDPFYPQHTELELGDAG